MSEARKESSERTGADDGGSLLSQLSRFPREPDRLIDGLRLCGAVLIRLWLRVVHRLRVEGRENVPPRGSFVLVSNHASQLDAPCLLSLLSNRRLHRAYPAAAADFFHAASATMALCARLANVLPFQRQGHARGSLALCRQVLAEPDSVLVLFPEGGRSRTGQMASFHAGVGWIVAGTDVPVIPCYLQGTREAWPAGGRFPRPRKLVLWVGEPRSYAELPMNAESARRIARDLEAAVRALGDMHG